MNFYSGRMGKVKKVRVRSANLLGKIDIGLAASDVRVSQTMLFTVFESINSCHAGELRG